MDLIGQDDTSGPHPGVPAFAGEPPPEHTIRIYNPLENRHLSGELVHRVV